MQSALQVTAVAYDNPIPGYHTNNTINLRLWAAKPDREFDLEAFNTGDYVQVRNKYGSWRGMQAIWTANNPIPTGLAHDSTQQRPVF